MAAFIICVSKYLSVYGPEVAIEPYKKLRKNAPAFCILFFLFCFVVFFFAHFKNQTTRKTDDEHGFIAQHKLNKIKCLNIQITTARI